MTSVLLVSIASTPKGHIDAKVRERCVFCCMHQILRLHGLHPQVVKYCSFKLQPHCDVPLLCPCVLFGSVLRNITVWHDYSCCAFRPLVRCENVLGPVIAEIV